MGYIWPWFFEAIVGIVAGALCLGMVRTIKLLARMQRALDHLGPSVETIYMLFPFIIRTLGHQNDSLKEVGANGSTDKANECISEAEKLLEKRHAALEGGLGICREG